MTIRWTPDTCNCIVDLEQGTTKYVDWVQKCEGHKDLDGQKLVDGIIKQCKKFQIKEDYTKDDMNNNVIEKQKEKLRITKSGPVIKRRN